MRKVFTNNDGIEVAYGTDPATGIFVTLSKLKPKHARKPTSEVLETLSTMECNDDFGYGLFTGYSGYGTKASHPVIIWFLEEYGVSAEQMSLVYADAPSEEVGKVALVTFVRQVFPHWMTSAMIAELLFNYRSRLPVRVPELQEDLKRWAEYAQAWAVTAGRTDPISFLIQIPANGNHFMVQQAYDYSRLYPTRPYMVHILPDSRNSGCLKYYDTKLPLCVPRPLLFRIPDSDDEVFPSMKVIYSNV